MVMKKTLVINDVEYEIINDYNDAIDKMILSEKITDYFDNFDYIFGDFSYDKVRLKGFNDSKNKNAKKINDIKYLDDYITNYCSLGAKVFLIKKLK